MTLIIHGTTILTMDEPAILREAERIATRAWGRLHAERPDLPWPPGLAPLDEASPRAP